MASPSNTKNEACLDLRSLHSDEERGATFWNTSVVEMKFSVEREWIKLGVLKESHVMAC